MSPVFPKFTLPRHISLDYRALAPTSTAIFWSFGGIPQAFLATPILLQLYCCRPSGEGALPKETNEKRELILSLRPRNNKETGIFQSLAVTVHENS